MEETREREQQLRRLAGHTFQVLEAERRRIGRLLHDDAAQSLAIIRLQLELIESSIPSPDPELQERLAEARAVAEKAVASVRQLISELSPAILEKLGLTAAIRQLVKNFQRTHESHIALDIGPLPQINFDLGILAYRSLQECLSNISRHSSAKNVNITVYSADAVLKLQVEDDGVGFDAEEAIGRTSCYGLLGIREQITLLGGTVEIQSTRDGGQILLHAKKPSTIIKILLPIPKISLEL